MKPLVALLRGWLALPRGLRAMAPIAVMALLWWSSSRQLGPDAGGPVRAFLHNGAHIVAYGGLGGTFWLALVGLGDLGAPQLRIANLASVALATAYGVVDELHQSHTPGRTCSVSDVFSDLLGALLAVAVLEVLLRRSPGFARALPFLAVACVAATAFATWGPW